MPCAQVSLIDRSHTTTTSYPGPAVTIMAVWTHRHALYPSAALWYRSPLEHGSSVRHFGISRASTDVISNASHGNLDHQSDNCAAEPLSRLVAVKGCASAQARAATQPPAQHREHVVIREAGSWSRLRGIVCAGIGGRRLEWPEGLDFDIVGATGGKMARGRQEGRSEWDR